MKKRKPKGYWTKANCIAEAKKYTHKKEWEINSKSSFTIAHRNGWMDICSRHMIKLGNCFHRAIYAVEFFDNHVYIGLTHDLDERISQHLRDKRSSVYKHFIKNNIRPKFKILTNYLHKDIAIIKENEFLNSYKDSGWTLLNKVQTGSLGGNLVFWTKERCIEDASKYSSKRDWYENSNTSYKKACKMNWLKDCTSHMKRPQSKKMKWTFELCKTIAMKYKSKWEWIKNSKNSYHAAYSQGWINNLTKHMK